MTSSPLTWYPAKVSSMRCCRKNPPGSHSKVNRPETLSSSESSVRPVTSQVPTNRSKRLSAGSGRGGCIAGVSWSCAMTTPPYSLVPYNVRLRQWPRGSPSRACGLLLAGHQREAAAVRIGKQRPPAEWLPDRRLREFHPAGGQLLV